MRTQVRIKKLITHTERVMKRMDAKTRYAFSKFGRFTRRTAQFSMKAGGPGKISRPGQPPLAHPPRKSVKRLIFWSYDSRVQSVVIGPLLLTEHRRDRIPRLLEKGGTVRRLDDEGVIRSLHYRERPYMEPAGRENLPKVAGFYAER